MNNRQQFIYRWRKFKNRAMASLALLSVVLALVPLFLIFFYTVGQGVGALNIDFFVQMPKPVVESGGGMANALVGTLMLIVMGSLIGVPVGVLAGVYLAEFGRNPFGAAVRFLSDVLSGIPSIVVGVVAYILVVIPMKTFSALAGGVALGILMIPTITRTTEEMIRLVPHSYREAGLALGLPQWKTTIRVILPAALKGITTGVLLGVARAAGETAPLLFTALGNRFWSTALDEPIASLTVFVYDYARSPFDDWIQQAWAAALVLVLLIFVLNLVFRFATKGRYGEQQV
jgi:phosphate transport system permease protein